MTYGLLYAALSRKELRDLDAVKNICKCVLDQFYGIAKIPFDMSWSVKHLAQIDHLRNATFNKLPLNPSL